MKNGQYDMFDMPVSRLVAPEGELVVSYGGGVNTIALLLALHDHGIRPRAITMANPGHEWKATIAYRDEIMRPWCERVGFPPITVVNRIEEGVHRVRAWRLETLGSECMRMHSLPSVAYGWKKCSQKYKAEPQRWWTERQEWAKSTWAAGQKVIRVIGYDRDEEKRVLKARSINWAPALEMLRFSYWHPLYELGLDRDGCCSLIGRRGMPLPPKSACTYCPNNTLEEWQRLRIVEPDSFAYAVNMSRNAQVDSPDVVGLMRCNPHGKRQLHVWAEGGYGEVCSSTEPEQDCECST